jgi:MFS family permease
MARWPMRSAGAVSCCGSLALFFGTSVGCAMATTIEQLWLARALAGMCAGAGMVIGRAIVRDLFEGAQAQKLMSTIQLLFALAPAAAPIIGGWVFGGFGWRATFWFLAAVRRRAVDQPALSGCPKRLIRRTAAACIRSSSAATTRTCSRTPR